MARTNPPLSLTDQVTERLAKEPKERRVREYSPEDLVPSGSTLLNLACSDQPSGAYGLGKIVTLPGTSSAGKTLLMLTTFAESNKMKHLDEHRFVYDDVEAALEFDTSYLFGESTAARIQEPPHGSSDTIQHFKANILSLSEAGKPFIYCLDSFDALSSDEELEKEMRKALAMAKSEEAARKIAGSYGTEKAKIAGQVLRMVKQELSRTNSLLIMIQQVRQNIGAGPFQQKYVTSGGEAPFFYSTHQVWLSRVSTLKSKERKIGSEVKAEVKKNKLTGKLRDCSFQVFYDYGVDNIGSCIDFLVDEGFWKKSGQKINAVDLGFELARTKLIDEIEKDPELEQKLTQTTAEAWKEIEDDLRLDRRPKYD